MTASEYLLKLESALWPLKEAERRDFVSEMQGHIDELKERHPDKSEADLVAGLTPPEELAAELLAEEDEEKTEACRSGTGASSSAGQENDSSRAKDGSPKIITISIDNDESGNDSFRGGQSGSEQNGAEADGRSSKYNDRMNCGSTSRNSESFEGFSRKAGSNTAAKLRIALNILSEIGSAFGMAGGGDIDLHKDLDGLGIGSLRVSLLSGDLSLRPSADSAFHISARGLESENQLTVEIEEGSLCVTEHSGFRSGIDTVEISVPATVPDLDLSTGSGDMDIERISAGIHARTRSGDIGARACPGSFLADAASGDISLEDCGSASASSRSGDIEARDIHGDFAGRSASGGIRVSGVEGKLGLESSSGDIDVESQGGALAAKSISGDIDVVYTGSLGSAEASSVSGDISLKFAAQPDASVEAFSRSGSIRVGDSEEEGRGIRTQIGKGGASLKAMTVSGDIDINW